MIELLSASGPIPLPDDHASSSAPHMQHTSDKLPQVAVSTSRSLKVKSKGVVSWLKYYDYKQITTLCILIGTQTDHEALGNITLITFSSQNLQYVCND